MSQAVLIIGDSGTGKSTSIRTLPHEETFIINTIDKPLPFKGSSKLYKKVCEENPKGNYYSTDSSQEMLRYIDAINQRRPDIKYLIIDDFGYVITRDYMSRALIKGYDKFSEIASSAWNVLDKIKGLRPDLTVFVIMHSDIKDDGIARPKTIGKVLDDKVKIEGMYTHVLHSLIVDGKYCFLTQHDGQRTAKMPMDMFDSNIIPNDLKLVADAMSAYYNLDEDVPQ